ncbi:hypothetical protein VUR80DRAFT_6831 [Thermomyces stellatus]
MSKPGLSLGLSLSKKPSKPAPAKRKPVFGGDSDEDDAPTQDDAHNVEEVTELGVLELPPAPAEQPERKGKKKNGPITEPPTLSKTDKKPPMMFGDLSGSLTSKKNAEEGEKVDKSIYEYDTIYESIRPKKKTAAEDEGGERKSRYMSGLMAASSIRKRDQQIAEEKRIAREREAEGEEFADKEKFVTAAYRRQQEENRKAAEEEKRREEEEGKNNIQGGMSGFYRTLLDREDKERAEMIKQAEEKAKKGETEEQDEEKTDEQVAKEMKERGVSVVVNEDGEVVDKRQLLKGGLNVVAKKREPPKKAERPAQREQDWRGQGKGFVGAGGGKRAMVERHSRMLEQQLEESLKRSREAEEEEKAKTVEKMVKSRKTEGDISSARERYLARKREAEEAKKAGLE